MITRGFQGRRLQSDSKRLPPGQHPTADFPVLSAEPTPHTPLHDWTFTLEAENGARIASWNWDEFRALGATDVTVDIHCVTRWSKLDTRWEGVAFSHIAEVAQPKPSARFAIFHAEGGFTSHPALSAVLGAWHRATTVSTGRDS